ncbi:hypothetical protein JTF06_02910 [Desemzia sp. RIT804]|uniref:hypothetical protein n=1 Tax=Desemzia sp. RIT 804 TaxID=2810209 RepID=UPI001950F52A|nr:hypothetical protein [Desemzia sp. RIT 804]MBM6613844.1 hypothetical protein [Desemzia sp. RIT 804]
MEQMSFEPPTDHYDERIATIDEQICQLINQRKELSNNNPGFPTKQYIADWSKKHHFYEDFLNSIFSNFFYEDVHRPVVKPTGFRKNIPILKSFEREDEFYSVTFMRQYENASTVHLNIDSNAIEDISEWQLREMSHFELSIKGSDIQYDCRNEGGGGSMGSETFMFVVSPALPDDKSKYKLVFKEYKAPFQKETGFEFVI